MASRYLARALRFECLDESGGDFFGSDEPYWVFTARSGDASHTTRSKVFGDVDSGDRRDFDDSAVVWPRKGADEGAEGPIGLTVQLWESDQGDPDEVTRQTARAFEAGESLPIVGDWLEEVPDWARELLGNALGDDMMGSHTVGYPTARLRRRLPQVGDRIRERFRFGGSNGDLPFTVAGGPDYDLVLEVVRVG